MIYKRCGRCGKRIKQGKTCECAKRMKAQRDRVYDRYSRNSKASAFYNTSEWRSLSKVVQEAYDGIDQYELATTGRIVAADTVHHIVEISEDWQQRLCWDNLIPVSASSHARIHGLYRTHKAETQRFLANLIRGRGAF